MKIRSWFILAVVALALMYGACGDDDNGDADDVDAPTSAPLGTEVPAEAVAPGFEQFSAFRGPWQGFWTNTTFGSTGEVVADGTVIGDGTGFGSVDIGGLVFGAVDPDAKNFSATYDGDVLTIEVAGDDVFGDVTITISADGQLAMEAANVPDEAIDKVTSEGTVTADQIDVTYDVFFTDGTTAKGTATLTR